MAVDSTSLLQSIELGGLLSFISCSVYFYYLKSNFIQDSPLVSRCSNDYHFERLYHISAPGYGLSSYLRSLPRSIIN